MKHYPAYRYWSSATIVLAILSALPLPPTLAQKKSILCEQENALETIRQQIELSKSINRPDQRIAILIRAADLLWPFQEPKARETFTDAFELALQSEREPSPERNPLLLMFKPDQRYVVVRAVARRNPLLAKKFTERILSDLSDSKSTNSSDERSEVLKAQRLLEAAIQLMSINIDLSVDLARKSLAFPASHMITRFSYALASVNQTAADQFYEAALNKYSERPMREFLYLKVYPFALGFDGDMPVNGYYQIPANFQPNLKLKSHFLSVLLRRAQQALETPLDEGDNFNRTSGNAHILETLMVLEPRVRGDLPEFLPELVQARESILITLPLETQKDLTANPSGEPEQKRSFEDKIELAEKNPDPAKRFDEIVSAILLSWERDPLSEILKAIDKVDDLDFRQVLSDWIYLERAKIAVERRQFEEAEKLTLKVDSRLERSYLLIALARELLKRPETKTRAIETINKAVSEVQKLEPSVPAARELLTASTLLARTNRSRALILLSDAARQINRIDNPDFSVGDQTVEKQFKRRSNRGGRFSVRFFMPGAGPEAAFSEIANVDYDNALTQTSIFTDSFTRTSTTLAVVDVCLQKLPLQKKPK